MITPLIHTSRATLRMATEKDIPAILRFYTENAARFAPTDPQKPDGFYTEPFWIERIAHGLQAWSSEQALNLFIFESEAKDVVGSVSLSQMCRGPFQAFYLGYSLDGKREGTGLMRETLEAVIRFAFQDLNFHRIMANHLPENQRSAGILKRLGFVTEGLAKEYLFIDGRWRDHVLNSLTNPNWRVAK